MPEETQTAAVAQTATAETTAGESQSQEQTGSVETEKQSTASTGEQTKTQTQGVQQESKPQSRRSAAYRIQQLTRQNAELKKSKAQESQQDGEQGNEGGENHQAPDVGQEVDKRLKPIVDEFSKSADDGELKEFFSGDKVNAKAEYEPKIRDMWKLDQYKDVAASDLYKILTYDSSIAAAKVAAVEEYKAAEKKAKDEASGGHSSANRSGSQGKSVSTMSAAELQAHNDRIKAGIKS